MKKFRKYGEKPFNSVLVHGGPGAVGEMAPVAQALSSIFGIIEPFQTESTVDGQVEELRQIIEENSDVPVSLAGFSWGAWLGIIFAADYPELVKKLILIGCGPLEEKYAAGIMKTRLSRMDDCEKEQIDPLLTGLNSSDSETRLKAFQQLGKLFSKADSYDPLDETGNDKDIVLNPDIFKTVWREASEMRRTGKLITYTLKLKCPVTAIHGDYDSHQADGVEKPLEDLLDDFKFIVLEKCGHKPWIEKQAAAKFYTILKNELI